MTLENFIYESVSEILDGGYEEVKEVIEKHKKEKCNVAIFITGKENYPEILEKIIVKQVELNRNVC